MSEAAWSKLWVRVLVIGLFIFALYSNVQLITQNYQVSQRTSAAQADVARMSLRNKQLSLLLSYYQSPSYQDVEARRRLGMKRADETVFAVKGITIPDLNPNDELESTVYYQAAQPAATAATESNFSKWLKYLSGNK